MDGTKRWRYVQLFNRAHKSVRHVRSAKSYINQLVWLWCVKRKESYNKKAVTYNKVQIWFWLFFTQHVSNKMLHGGHLVLLVIGSCNSCFIACSHRRHGQDNTVLSCPCRQCEHNWRQDKTVLSCLDRVSNFQVFSSAEHIWDRTVANWKLGRDETKNRRHGQDKTRQFCLVRVGGVNKLLVSAATVVYSAHTVRWAVSTCNGLARTCY